MEVSGHNKGVSQPILDRPVMKSPHCSEVEGEATFTVMSYNILNDVYARKDPFLKNTPEHLLCQKTRWETGILLEIRHFDADIVGLQEMWGGIKDLVSEDLSRLGYTGVVQQRPGHEDYVGLFVKISSFTILESKGIDHAPAAAQMIEGEGAAKDAARAELHSWHKAGVIARLQHVQNGRTMVVATLHASWTQFQRLDVQCCELSAVMHHASKLWQDGDGLVVCGDFNVRPNEAVYELLTKGELGPQTLQGMTNIRPLEVGGKKLSLVDVVPELFKTSPELQSAYFVTQGKEPEATNVWVDEGPDLVETLDYIMFSPALRPLSVVDSCPYSVFSATCKGRYPPDENFPSDHQSVVASFGWA